MRFAVAVATVVALTDLSFAFHFAGPAGTIERSRPEVSKVSYTRPSSQKCGFTTSFGVRRSAKMSNAVEDGIEALIFDCDGTLVNSMPIWAENWRVTCAEFGLEFTTEMFFRHAGKTVEETLRVICAEQQVEAVSEKDFLRRKDELVEELLPLVKEIEPVTSIARAHAGSLKMAVVSSGPRYMVQRLLTQARLDTLFDVVVCAEDCEKHKPDPEPFLRAASTLGVDPARCRAFEDADAGCEAVRAAGMQLVDVRGLEGYPTNAAVSSSERRH